MKALQLFSDDYLEQCKALSSEQIIQFLDNFRLMAYEATKDHKSKLISIKVPIPLLEAFKNAAKLQKQSYQAIIKELMSDWLLKK